MKTVFNFSHPLESAQMDAIEYYLGGEFNEVRPRNQIDFGRPLNEQVTEMVSEAFLISDGVPPDAIIAPSLGAVAFLIGRIFHRTPLVWIVPVKDSLPPRFKVKEVVP